jgi:zinc protease
MKALTRLPALLAAALLILPLAAEAQQRQMDANTKLPLDPQVIAGTLPNGLRYFVRQNAKPEQRAELRLVVNAGSILEDDDQLGLAHLVEHMAFNGTRNFAKQELVDYLESIGMRFGPDLNAYTSFDETVYMLMVPTDSAKMVRTAFQILEDWAWGVTMDGEEIDKERGVVIEEWRRGQGAGMRMQQRQFPILFHASRYAERLPIGKPEILQSFEHETLRRFYREWYRPDLMAVVAVGDFDPQQIVLLIEEHFGRIPAPDKARPRPQAAVPDHAETLFAIATDREATGSNVSIYFKRPEVEEGTLGAYRRQLVERLYNGMLNRRFFELTQEAEPPFLGASSGGGRIVRARSLYFLGAGAQEGQIERALEALLTEAERVQRFGFTASELQRQKADLQRSFERAFAERENTESARLAADYVRHYLQDAAVPGIEIEAQLAQALIPGITVEEVNRVARELITDGNRVVMVSAPEKEGVRVPTEAELAAVFRAVAAKEIAAYEETVSDEPLLAVVPAPRPVTAEKTIAEIGVQEWTLANGARVVLKQTDFKADEILFRAFAPGGASLMPDAQALSAMLAGNVIGVSGVGSFRQTELENKLAGKAVRVSPFFFDLEHGLAGSASPRDVETLFQLAHLYFTAPRADSAAFASLTGRIRASLQNQGASPEQAFRDTFQVTFSQHHPRALPLTAERMNEVDLGTVMRFYRERFADASGFTFVFVGSIDPAELRALSERYLATLPAAGRTEQWRDTGVRPPAGVVEKVVRRGIEEKSQTRITFSGPFEYSRENQYALGSMVDVLDIRLRETLREEMSGVYGVQVSGSGSRDPRPEFQVTIAFTADPERLEELVAAAFEQIALLQRNGADEKDLAKVRETQRRSRETNLKQNGYWLGQLAARYRMGTDPREILSYEQLIDTLDSKMVQEAARTYLPANNYVRVSLYPEE